uniref:Uncharacterized protein n=1 Tax=Ananas comosus var. bracteatus TaxID=296719 RepID=A0A6V7NGJ9_ANACO|nr:unnamed protein product [Ananas comosus var. bracteatus]
MDVYFSVDSFPDYCRLSGRKLDDNLAGGGGRASVDLRKRNPADFALWKSAKPGHAFDIHGGGKDLIFPHHENELAQSRAACPESNVNYWMHNGFVNRDNQKMSKSDNNFFTIRDIIEKYHPLALSLNRIGSCLLHISASMSDDLHTTAVLDDLMEPLKAINSNLKKFKGKKQQQSLIQALIALEKEVKDVLGILGLMPSSSCAEVFNELKVFLCVATTKREALKRAGCRRKNSRRRSRRGHWRGRTNSTANPIGSGKSSPPWGIALMDEPGGTLWRPCEPERPED